MTVETEVNVKRLQAQVKELQDQMAQVMQAIWKEANSNAVIEGDEAPREVRNGKSRKTR